jgi:basic membrane protein A
MLLGLLIGITVSPENSVYQLTRSHFEQSELSWKVAAVFMAGYLGENDFNDQVHQALVTAKNKWRIDFEISKPTQFSQYENHLRNFVENPSYSEPYDLIIAVSFEQADALQAVADDYPDQKFAIVDYYIDTTTYPNIASLLFDEAEGSALVGAVAGLTTISDKVGFIGGMDIAIINKFKDGFLFGANYTNPMLDGDNITIAYTNDWADLTAGQTLADAAYAAGTDVIFTIAGHSGRGIFASAKNNNGTTGFDNPLWAIGGVTPQMYWGCIDLDNPAPPTVGLTSLVLNATPGIVSIVSHILNGTFSGGIKMQNAENNGVHIELRPDLYELPQGIIDDVEDIREGIINGSIVVPASQGGTPITERDVTGFKPIRFRTISNDNMSVTTFVSPDGSKEELRNLLLSANDSIHVEIYGINSPFILELIHDIHSTKPSLDMKFLIGWNSLGYVSQNRYVANNLTLLGYPVKWTNSSDYTYAHQKFFIIDNETVVVQSGNWAKTSFPEVDDKANREWSVAVTDEEIADFYLSVFHHDWNRGTDYDSGIHGTGTPLTYNDNPSTYTRPFAAPGRFSGPMSITPIVSNETSLEGILWCINQSRFTLDIQIPYFTSVGDAGAVDEVIAAILSAKDRGVTVRVISEEEKDWVEIEQILIDHGIPIVWQDTRWFTANHNKGIIVDGIIVLVSSINYSDTSITENREAGVIIQQEGIAQWFQDIYDFDWGIADAVAMDEVNLDWHPNIPTSSDTTNVTVYAHGLYPNIEEVILGVKIGDDAWTNNTITSNVYGSAEGDLENYFYELSPQTHGTIVTVQAYIKASGIWHTGVNMTIHILDTVTDYCTTNNPSHMIFEEGTTGLTITWTPEALRPSRYVVFKNGIEIDSGAWNGSIVETSLEGLSSDLYNYTLFVNDTVGNYAVDTVLVGVYPSTAPTISDSINLEIEYGSTENSLVWTTFDEFPGRYEIVLDGTLVKSDSLNQTSESIHYNVDNLSLGSHNVTVIIYDLAGNTNSDTAFVTVFDTTAPTTNHPDDIVFQEGALGQVIAWSGSDLLPAEYEIHQNGEIIRTGSWNSSGETITHQLVSLSPGEYNFTLALTDLGGNTVFDTVLVSVVASSITSTTTSNTTATDQFPLTNEIILIIAAAVVMIIIVLGGLTKRR